MKLKMRCHSGTDCTTTGPVTVQSNDVSFGFKTANTYNANRATGHFQCSIDIKGTDLHSKGSASRSSTVSWAKSFNDLKGWNGWNVLNRLASEPCPSSPLLHARSKPGAAPPPLAGAGYWSRNKSVP